MTCYSAAEDRNDITTGPSGLPSYRSTVSEVRVAFFATGENNRPVENLTQADFAVVDGERVVRSFRSFAHSGEAPLDVVALVDLSESAAPRFRVAMNEVLKLVVREQSIPDDRIAVISFGGMRPALLCASGCGDSSSIARLLAVKTGGATPLFDALRLAADFLSASRPRRGTACADFVLRRQRHHQPPFGARSAGDCARRRRSDLLR